MRMARARTPAFRRVPTTDVRMRADQRSDRDPVRARPGSGPFDLSARVRRQVHCTRVSQGAALEVLQCELGSYFPRQSVPLL